MISLGIDIAGGSGKALTIAFVRWGTLGASASVTFGSVPLGRHGNGYPIYDWPRIVQAAAKGKLTNVANLSYPIAQHVCFHLKKAIKTLKIEHNKINVYAVDSPSGFSRNTLGHGRATEKVGHIFNFCGAHIAYFQMTPSVACKRDHRGKWAWMLFGMATFYSISTNFKINPKSWQSFLDSGIKPPTFGNKKSIIEVFPRATIQRLRCVNQQPQQMASIIRILNSLANATKEVQLIKNSLQSGSRTGSDKADALISALTTVGLIYPTKFTMTALQNQKPSKYSPPASSNIPWRQEGIIYVVE